MAFIRNSLILFIATFTTNALSEIIWDDYRRELKEMSLKNHRPLSSYSYARRIIMQRLHLKKDHNGYFIEDVYCHQLFRKRVGPNSMPNHTEINVEHTWPQSRFSRRAQRGHQKADLHHLYPSDSHSNSVRGNHYFSEVERGDTVDYDCRDSLIGHDPKTGREAFEPPEDHKGNVARALFYFSIRYDIEIPESEEFFLRMWNVTDPVDADEIRRNDIVEREQGNRNPFIDHPEYAGLISNF